MRAKSERLRRSTPSVRSSGRFFVSAPSDQGACADALRNKLLDSYRAVREAAKQRQRATSTDAPRNEKGQLQRQELT